MLAVVILAAGKGTRMNSDLPKVLHPLRHRALIDYVIDAALELNPNRLIVVVGHRREDVTAHLGQIPAEYVVQEPQLGTGHAVMQTAARLLDFDGEVIVLSGDVPLLRAATVQRLLEAHQSRGASATVLSTIAPNPFGYGRILRDAERTFVRIVEEREASPEERAVTEINTGIYCFCASSLFEALTAVRADNTKGEYYLTDVIAVLRERGHSVQAVDLADFWEVRGINTPAELADAEGRLGDLMAS